MSPLMKEYSNIEFNHITLEVINKNKNINSKLLKVVDNISGLANSGEIIALMGPSGSGKSSLLRLLAGSVDKSSYTNGSFLINGEERVKEKWFKSFGFLDQDDVIFENLTVEETIRYACKFRNKNLSEEKQEVLISETLHLLGLKKVKKTIMKKVSGGERKRALIGVELVSQPKVMFMDEPTSGLDSVKAKMLVANIRKIVDETKIIVFLCIHQPSEEVFNMFDRLILMKESRVLYSGLVKSCEEELKEIGIVKPGQISFPDFLLELASLHENYQEESVYANSVRKLEEKYYKKNKNEYSRDESGTSEKYIRYIPDLYETLLLTKRILIFNANTPAKILKRTFWAALLAIIRVHCSFVGSSPNIDIKDQGTWLYSIYSFSLFHFWDKDVTNISHDKFGFFSILYADYFIPYIVSAYFGTCYLLYNTTFSYYLDIKRIKRELNVNSYAIGSYWCALILSNIVLNSLYECACLIFQYLLYRENITFLGIILLFPVNYVFNIVLCLALASYLNRKLMISILINFFVLLILFNGPWLFLFLLRFYNLFLKNAAFEEKINLNWMMFLPFIPMHYLIFYLLKKNSMAHLRSSNFENIDKEEIVKYLSIIEQSDKKMNSIFNGKELNMWFLTGMVIFQFIFFFIFGLFILGRRYMPELRLKLEKYKKNS